MEAFSYSSVMTHDVMTLQATTFVAYRPPSLGLLYLPEEDPSRSKCAAVTNFANS